MAKKGQVILQYPQFNRQTIQNFLNGNNVTEATMIRIAKVLGISETELSDLRTPIESALSSNDESDTRRRYTKQDLTTSLTQEVNQARKDGWNFVERKFTDESGNLWDVNKILTCQENIIILGDAGSGKTTQLQSIALELVKIEEDETIPIYVDLSKNCPDKKHGLLERIIRCIPQRFQKDDFGDYRFLCKEPPVIAKSSTPVALF